MGKSPTVEAFEVEEGSGNGNGNGNGPFNVGQVRPTLESLIEMRDRRDTRLSVLLALLRFGSVQFSLVWFGLVWPVSALKFSKQPPVASSARKVYSFFIQKDSEYNFDQLVGVVSVKTDC